MNDHDLSHLFRAIAAGDSKTARQLLDAKPALAQEPIGSDSGSTRSAPFFLEDIRRAVYAGDTPLHIAAAAYQLELVRELIDLGADISARNRRGAEPLHSAAVGALGEAFWKPAAQAAVIEYLIEKGANANAVDMSGVTPLHRAVRTRSAAAVEALLVNGADPTRPNKSGSTPRHLASITSGRSGSGSTAAREQQVIIEQLLA